MKFAFLRLPFPVIKLFEFMQASDIANITKINNARPFGEIVDMQPLVSSEYSWLL